jgi:hypothetical protein
MGGGCDRVLGAEAEGGVNDPIDGEVSARRELSPGNPLVSPADW